MHKPAWPFTVACCTADESLRTSRLNGVTVEMAGRHHEGPDNDDALFDMQALDQFDYIRFTLTDMNGIGRSMAVPRRHVDHSLHDGLGFYAGTGPTQYTHQPYPTPQLTLPAPRQTLHLTVQDSKVQSLSGSWQGELRICPAVVKQHSTVYIHGCVEAAESVTLR